MSEERLLQLVVAYFKSGPESLTYPGMSDETPLYDLLDEIEKYRPGFIKEVRGE